MSIKKEEKYTIEVEILGETLHLRKWKGKDVKIFTDILNNSFDIENLTLQQLQKLVQSCIKDYSGTYYSEFDLTYMLFLIRKETLGNNISFEYLCSECEEDMILDVNIEETILYTKDEFTEIAVGDTVFTLNKIIKADVLDQKEKSKEYEDENPVLLEFALRVSEFKDSNGVHNEYTYEELFEYINDLELKDFEELITKFIEQMSYFQCTGVYECGNEKCKTQHNLEFDVLPNFFGKI